MQSPEALAQLVFVVRGEKVMFDADLAMLYGVEARSLNQAVKRNRKRFPPDFMFQLTQKEYDTMRSQIVTTSGRKGLNSSQIVMSSRKHWGRAYRP
jgi:ORF6N domain-containing protein